MASDRHRSVCRSTWGSYTSFCCTSWPTVHANKQQRVYNRRPWNTTCYHLGRTSEVRPLRRPANARLSWTSQWLLLCQLPKGYRYPRKCILTLHLSPAGGRHALTYDQLKSRYPHIAPHKLHAILRDALCKQQAETSLGLTSLLQGGVHVWRLVLLVLLRLTTLLKVSICMLPALRTQP